MNLRRTTCTALLAATAAAVLPAAPALAQPEPDSYRSALVGDTVVTTLSTGSFELHDDGRSVAVRDDRGDQVATLPLTVLVHDLSFPLRHSIAPDGRQLTLTPDPAALSSTNLTVIASPVEEALALNRFAGDLGRNTAIGTAVGTLVGAGIGVAAGLVTCLVVGPGCLATIPAAAGVFAGGGAIVGTLLGGAAAVADAGWQYLVTLNSPPGESPYANQGMLDPNGTGVPDAGYRPPTGSGSGLQSGSGAVGGGSSGGN